MTSDFVAQVIDRFWQERAAEYADQTATSAVVHVVKHDDQTPSGVSLYTWTPGVSGAFGGRRYIVTMDDGRVLGPGSNLWHRGQIPDDMLDRFPPNGRIEYAGEDPRC